MIEELYKNYLIKKRDGLTTRKINQSIDKINFIDFATNDYLCMSKNQKNISAGYKAAKNYGAGATGSRLLSGNYDLISTFEHEIALAKKTENALIFNSGFQCNITTLSALISSKVLGRKPLVFFDKLNHASLYQAALASDVDLIRFNHNDMDHLQKLLEKFEGTKAQKFIVVETVYGMDGDILPIDHLLDLARKYNCFLYFDEAHATGIVGHNGYGLTENYNLENLNYVIVGTFSKALGSSGAYVACSNIIRDYLINFGGGFIYSTAIAPFSLGSAQNAWLNLPNYNEERLKIMELANYLRHACLKIGLECGNSATNIVPIIFNSVQLTKKVKDLLYENRINVSAIFPPTVPSGKSRIRIAINASHDISDINRIISILEDINE